MQVYSPMNHRSKTICPADLFFGILTSLLLGVKCLLFYDRLHLAGYVFPLTVASMAIHYLIYSILLRIHPKAAKIISFTLYAIGSLFMSVDLVYFSYVSKLPSAALLGTLWQMSDIRKSRFK